jgi:hypothetical protein
MAEPVACGRIGRPYAGIWLIEGEDGDGAELEGDMACKLCCRWGMYGARDICPCPCVCDWLAYPTGAVCDCPVDIEAEVNAGLLGLYISFDR